MALSWPITRLCSSSSMRNRRAVSVSFRRVSGMPVQLDTMKPISSSVSSGRFVLRSSSHSSWRPDRSLQIPSRSRSSAARSKSWIPNRLILQFSQFFLLDLQIRNIRRRYLGRQPGPRASLINDIDRLVRQESVGDVAIRSLTAVSMTSSVMITRWCSS